MITVRASVAQITADTTYIFARGMGGQNVYPAFFNDRNIMYLPRLDVDNEEFLVRKRTIERLDMVREELMVVTWHPKRICTWCLEYDDEFFKSDEILHAYKCLT